MSLKSYINTVISPDDHSIDSNFMKIVLNKICDGLDSKTSKTEMGNLSDLNTTAKTNLVAAINEAAASGGSSAVYTGELGGAPAQGPDNIANADTALILRNGNTIIQPEDVHAGMIVIQEQSEDNVTVYGEMTIMSVIRYNLPEEYSGQTNYYATIILGNNIKTALLTTEFPASEGEVI